MTEWSNLERKGTSNINENDKDVQLIASASLNARTIVAAVKAADNNLQVIVWQLFEDGSVARINAQKWQHTSSVGICVLNESRFVTASRTLERKLELTVWDFDSSLGLLIRGNSNATDDEVEKFAIATVRRPTIVFSSGVGESEGDNMVVTASRGNSGVLRLICWRINLDGTIDQLDKVNEQSGQKVQEISMAAYDSYPDSIGSFATAVTTDLPDRSHYPRLKVISWSVDLTGRITQHGHEFGKDESATHLSASPLCHRRIIISYKDSKGTLVIQKWNFGAYGDVISGPIGRTNGAVTDHSVTTQNTTRVFTAVRITDGTLKIILWDATADSIIRLQSEPAGGIKNVSAVSLGADWICTIVTDKENNLKVIAWREHSLSLLRGDWGSGTAPTVLKSTEASLPGWVEPPFPSDFGLKDPMIAVGFNFVIASQDHGIIFLDKNGQLLPSKHGEKCALKTDEFFSTFTRSKNADGTTNENCIHRHMGYSPVDNMFYPPGHECDPESEMRPPCIDEFYDTRIHFDPQSRRFFVFAPCRNCKEVTWLGDCDEENGINGNKSENVLNRRYFAIAVSKTEDPRDGFYQWLSTEAYIADAPEFTVNRGVMVISKKVWDIERNPFGFRPLLYLISAEDLVDGKPYPRSHKFFGNDIPNYNHGDLSPLIHYGYTHGRTYLISKGPDPGLDFLRESPGNYIINVYSINNPVDWTNVSSIEHTSALLPISVSGSLFQRERPVYRNKKIYFTWMELNPYAFGLPQNDRYKIGVVCIPLNNLNKASTLESDGFRCFEIPDVLNQENSPYSIEEPTITVNKNGDMIVLYCRIGYVVVLNPETRYAIIRANQYKPSSDIVVKSGQFTPMIISSDANVPNKYNTLAKQLDYHTIVVDPHDDETIWMITEYAKAVDINNQDGYRTIIYSMKVL